MNSKLKWFIFAGLGIWGLLSLLIAGGEAEPETSFATALAIRIGALGSFIVCLIVGKYCHRKGLLPDTEE